MDPEMKISISDNINEDNQMRSLLLDDHSEIKTALKGRNLDDVFRIRENGCSLYYKNIKSLNNHIEKRCIGVGDRSVITLFDKTPFPISSTDVVCPHFIELKWANGCRFDCAWCYLNGTFRFRADGKAPYLKDPEKITLHLRTYLEKVKEPTVLNSGELSDSLVFEGGTYSLTKDIIPIFKEQDRHKLLILTKSANVKNLIKANAQDHVIVSLSVNAVKVARRWEKKAPTPVQRLRAAKELSDAGYQVRLRIDPMVPIEGWKEDYKELVEYIFKQFRPNRITLGTLRGLQSTLIHSEDTSWAEYLDDNSNWGKKINSHLRAEMYTFIINLLRNKYKYNDFSICKETIEMWKMLGLEYKNMKCNCSE